jgi:membrane-associated HD superfamily phosphohydrolase
VLLADACEASAREVDRADEAALRGLVRRRIHEAFEEGQLDACDLTLRDLGLLGDALTRGLLSLQPAQAPEPRREPEERGPTVKLVGEP